MKLRIRELLSTLILSVRHLSDSSVCGEKLSPAVPADTVRRMRGKRGVCTASQEDVSHVRPRTGGVSLPAGSSIGRNQWSQSKAGRLCLRLLQGPRDASAPQPDPDSGHAEECAAERPQTAEQLFPSGVCERNFSNWASKFSEPKSTFCRVVAPSLLSP